MSQISHYGTVVGIGSNTIKVKITRYSACHNCDMRHGCGLMECQDKILEIVDKNTSKYKIGEEVLVSISGKMGLNAVLVGYVFPLILMILILAMVYIYTQSDLLSGISAIIILIPYYLGLFLTRKRIAKKFAFTVSKLME